MFTTRKNRPTEFEVQALVYHVLKLHFNNVRGEYRYKPHRDKRGAIFDVVVLDDNDNPAVVIEVKRGTIRPCKTGQIERYGKLANCPVLLVNGYTNMTVFVKTVEKALISHIKSQYLLKQQD